jgi:hypothetical protein
VGRFSPVARYATVFSREITERGGHLSATDEPIRFEQHIKPLFQERDRQSMKMCVRPLVIRRRRREQRRHTGTLREGTMPCDGAWLDEQIAFFEGWVEAGTPA